jgi:hypothetical protein
MFEVNCRVFVSTENLNNLCQFLEPLLFLLGEENPKESTKGFMGVEEHIFDQPTVRLQYF